MVQLRTRKREMRRYGGNYHETLGLRRNSCASQFTIPDTACARADPECYYTDTTSSKPNHASHTPYFSYPLVSPTSFSSSSSISLVLVHNSTIIAEHKVRSLLSISPCHDHELTPSTTYTKYNIHRVQHTLSTAYTEYSIHPRFFVFPPFSWWRVDPWMWLQLPTCLPTRSTAISRLSMRAPWSSCLVTFPRLWVNEMMKRVSAPGAPSIDCLTVLVQTHLVMASRFARSWPPSASTHWLDHNLGVHLYAHSITASKWISKLSWLRPRSPSPNLLDHGLQTRSITASKCISNLAQSQSRSPSLVSFDHGLQVYFQIRSITASKCVSKLAGSRSRRVSLSSLDPHSQAHLELLSSTACSQFRYTGCRWVAI